MFRIHTVALAVLVVAHTLGQAPARAEPQFSAEDIVRHFQQQQSVSATKTIAPEEVSTVRAGAGDGTLQLPLTGARRKSSTALPQLPAAGKKNTTQGGYDLLITFETGSDRLTQQAQLNLTAFATALKTPALSGFAFEVQGHTDAVGPADTNQTLSERRAESVVSYLVGLGIESGRLRAKGFGESQPLMSDPNHANNRRVETRRIQ
ncbi:MAG: OmpA family protein [Pseudomonadota bacterium]